MVRVFVVHYTEDGQLPELSKDELEDIQENVMDRLEEEEEVEAEEKEVEEEIKEGEGKEALEEAPEEAEVKEAQEGEEAYNLSDIDGLSPSRIGSLSEIGIESLADLSSADPSDVIEQVGGVGVTENQVESWIEQAKKLTS